VRLINVLRTSAFRFTLLFMALFGAMALALLAFIYWSTVAVIHQQTSDTIESEIRGLAEQYEERGLPGLIQVIQDRSGERGNDDNVYLLTTPALVPLAGNLAGWPQTESTGDEWLALTLSKMDGGTVVEHQVRARAFELPGGYRLLVGRDTQESSRFGGIVLKALASSAGLTLALGLIGGTIFSRRVLSRVEAMDQTTRQIMAGDLSQRIAGNGSGDEFDRLADSLNVMLEQMERLMAGMRLATDSLAHDLRRPLTRLKARSELALRQPPDAEQDRQALAEVMVQADAALVTFDSLLKIAMAESGASAADFRTVDLSAIARDAADLYEPLAEENDVVLSVSADGPAPVRGQPELLAQSIANLIDNAVKYTPPGGRIEVAVAVAGNSAVLTVADSGPGVPEAERARVLDRFVRLEESRSSPGAGLGLSLVAAVARLHGAALLLEDNRPGLRVRVAIPRAAAPSDNDGRS
jgi:signal transduction histidine kinase